MQPALVLDTVLGRASVEAEEMISMIPTDITVLPSKVPGDA